MNKQNGIIGIDGFGMSLRKAVLLALKIWGMVFWAWEMGYNNIFKELDFILILWVSSSRVLIHLLSMIKQDLLPL